MSTTFTHNYVVHGRHVTEAPDLFFVVWPDEDGPMLDQPAIASRLLNARMQLADAWAKESLLTAPIQVPISQDFVSHTNLEIYQAHQRLRELYREFGLNELDATKKMERDRILLINAVNNATIARRNKACTSWVQRITTTVANLLSRDR